MIVFVSALGAFMLAAFATFYPQETFPWALIAVPIFGLLYGVLALGIWNGSRFWWVVNTWMWGRLLWRSAHWSVSDQPSWLETGWDFTQSMLRAMTAVVLLTLLFTPSLFRWIWSKDRTAP